MSRARRPSAAGDRPRFAHELAAEIHPKLFSGGLTAAHRYDAADRPAEEVKVVRADADRVVIRSRGRYGETTVRWEVEFDVDRGRLHEGDRADGDGPAAAAAVELLQPRHDETGAGRVSGPVGGRRAREGGRVRPAAHDVDQRARRPGTSCSARTSTRSSISATRSPGSSSPRRTSATATPATATRRVILEDGRRIDTDAVETEDGRTIRGADSRGRRAFLTQLYRREDGLRAGGVRHPQHDVPAQPRRAAREDVLVPAHARASGRAGNSTPAGLSGRARTR